MIILQQNYHFVKAFNIFYPVRKKDFKKPLIGTGVYTQTGIRRDTIEFVEYSQLGRVLRLIGKNSTYLPQELSMPDDILIIKRKINRSERPKTQPKKHIRYNFLRPDVYHEHLFLHGKTATATIFANNNTLITKGDTITFTHIIMAEKARKLTELIIFSTSS